MPHSRQSDNGGDRSFEQELAALAGASQAVIAGQHRNSHPRDDEGGFQRSLKGPIMSRRRPTRTTADFRVGDTVRVRNGVKDNDFPDIPLGGWAAVVTDVHDDGMFTVRWTAETLAAIHPVIRKRCETDGLDFETYWLGAVDLEPDDGGPLVIEQPREITTRPLSDQEEDDRVRMVFGLTSNDPLPDVNDETLAVYREFLSAKLVFPFTAEHDDDSGHRDPVQVIGLGDPDDPLIDESYGILCEGRLDGRIVTLPLSDLAAARATPQRQLIEDYSRWFRNW